MPERRTKVLHGSGSVPGGVTHTSKSPANAGLSQEVSEGTRTPDRLDHNQELYQLSYAHREATQSTSGQVGPW
jgi:hypothetical protein